jgi:hypothetical protein
LLIPEIKLLLREAITLNKTKGIVASMTYLFRVLFHSTLEVEYGRYGLYQEYKPMDFEVEFVDEHGKYAEGVEIIVVLAKNPLQRVVKAFVKTNNNGSFSFILDDFGPYKVIIRSPKRNAKIIENFRIQSNSGFFTSISLENLNFNKDGDWIWISN